MPRKVIHSAGIAETALLVCREKLRHALDSRGRASLVLSGGSTPLGLYALLAGSDLPWEKISVFWGDERFVPPEHGDSNSGAARVVLLEPAGVPETNIHPWPILGTPEESAEAYAGVLTRELGPEPVFDLTLLGLGADGHTASLFPRSPALRAPGLTAADRPATTQHARLTLTTRALSSSRTVMFLVSGDDKREALQELLAGDAGTADGDAPARAITALEELLVVTDMALRD